jgi:hypothetical protein
MDYNYRSTARRWGASLLTISDYKIMIDYPLVSLTNDITGATNNQFIEMLYTLQCDWLFIIKKESIGRYC